MKRWLSVLAVIALLATSVVTAVAALAEDADVVYTLSTIEKQPGEKIPAGTQIDIQVSVNEIPAVCVIEYKFCYDKTLFKPVSATKEGVLNKLDYADVTLDPASPVLGASDTRGEIWIVGMALDVKSSAANEVISTITFETLADVTATSRMFCIGTPIASDDPATATPLQTAFVDGGVSFKEAAPTTTTTTAPPVVSGKVSLLPPSASDFTCVPGGDGVIAVSPVGDGYKFTPDKGWPNAYYMSADPDEWITVDINDPDAMLYWDFTAANQANVLVFFAGQNPGDQAAEGTYCSINAIIDPSKKGADGTIYDLDAGTYKGSIHVSELGCAEQFMVDGKFTISGMKVFAVGGTVVVNELAAVGESAKAQETTTTSGSDNNETTTTENGETTTTENGETTTTENGETTTTENGETTTTVNLPITTTVPAPTTAAPTTTVQRQDTPKTDSPDTADTSSALLFVSVSALALAIVVMTATMKKQSV